MREVSFISEQRIEIQQISQMLAYLNKMIPLLAFDLIILFKTTL